VMQEEVQRQGLDMQGPPGHLLSSRAESNSRMAQEDHRGWTPSWEGGQGGPGVPLEPIPEAEGEESDWTSVRQEENASPFGPTEEVALGSSSPQPPVQPPGRTPLAAPPVPQWAGSAVDFQDDTGSADDPRFWHTKPQVLAAGLPKRLEETNGSVEEVSTTSNLFQSVAVTPPSSSASDVPEDLLQSLERASDGPQSSRAWARIGQFQQRQKNFTQARSAYQNAVHLDGSQHGCLANLAQLEAHVGNITRAQELLASAVKLDPGNKTYSAFGRWLASGSRPSQVSNGAGAGSSPAMSKTV